VRLSLLRATIHLVTTRDALAMRPLLQPPGDLRWFKSSPWWRRTGGVDLDALLSTGREIMSQRPHTVAELSRLLAARFPGHDGVALAYAVRALVPLVFTTPRGVWGAKGPVRLTTVEAWLGRPPGPAMTPDRLALRYLAAFGPASASDARTWSGLSMRDALERLRPRLRAFRTEGGVELFDLPDAPRPPENTPAPPRFLPDYDNILLAHADRTRIMGAGQHLGLFSPQGVMKGSLLLDGFLRATWVPVRAKGGTHLLITPFEKPTPVRERAAVEEEGERLLELLAPGEKHDIRFGMPSPRGSDRASRRSGVGPARPR
jgi:hypothetical protein